MTFVLWIMAEECVFVLKSDGKTEKRGPSRGPTSDPVLQSWSICLSHWGSVSDLAPQRLQRNTSQSGTTMVFHLHCCTLGGALKALLHNRNSAVGLGRQFSCCCEMDKSRPRERKCRPPLFLINVEAILSSWHWVLGVFWLKRPCHCWLKNWVPHWWYTRMCGVCMFPLL